MFMGNNKNGNKCAVLKHIESEYKVTVTLIDGNEFHQTHHDPENPNCYKYIKPCIRTNIDTGEIMDHVMRLEGIDSDNIKNALIHMTEQCRKVNWKYISWQSQITGKSCKKEEAFYDQYNHNGSYYVKTDFVKRKNPSNRSNKNRNLSGRTNNTSSHMNDLSGTDMQSSYHSAYMNTTGNGGSWNFTPATPDYPYMYPAQDVNADSEWKNDMYMSINYRPPPGFNKQDKNLNNGSIPSKFAEVLNHDDSVSEAMTGINNSGWAGNSSNIVPPLGGKKPKKTYLGKKIRLMPPTKNQGLAINKSQKDTVIQVTHLCEDGLTIAVQQPTHPSYNFLPQLEENLFHWYDRRGLKFSPQYFTQISRGTKNGTYCIVPNPKQADRYHRARVHAMLSNEDKVEVRFLDWGGYGVYSRADVFTLLEVKSEAFQSHLPWQAVYLELVPLIATPENTLTIDEKEDIEKYKQQNIENRKREVQMSLQQQTEKTMRETQLALKAALQNKKPEELKNQSEENDKENKNPSVIDADETRNRTSTVLKPNKSTESDEIQVGTGSTISSNDTPSKVAAKQAAKLYKKQHNSGSIHTQDILVRTVKKEHSFTIKPVRKENIVSYSYWYDITIEKKQATFYDHLYAEVVKEVQTPEMTISQLAKQYARIYTRHRLTGSKYYIDFGAEVSNYFNNMENAQASIEQSGVLEGNNNVESPILSPTEPNLITQEMITMGGYYFNNLDNPQIQQFMYQNIQAPTQEIMSPINQASLNNIQSPINVPSPPSIPTNLCNSPINGTSAVSIENNSKENITPSIISDATNPNHLVATNPATPVPSLTNSMNQVIRTPQQNFNDTTATSIGSPMPDVSYLSIEDTQAQNAQNLMDLQNFATLKNFFLTLDLTLLIHRITIVDDAVCYEGIPVGEPFGTLILNRLASCIDPNTRIGLDSPNQTNTSSVGQQSTSGVVADIQSTLPTNQNTTSPANVTTIATPENLPKTPKTVNQTPNPKSNKNSKSINTNLKNKSSSNIDQEEHDFSQFNCNLSQNQMTPMTHTSHSPSQSVNDNDSLASFQSHNLNSMHYHGREFSQISQVSNFNFDTNTNSCPSNSIASLSLLNSPLVSQTSNVYNNNNTMNNNINNLHHQNSNIHVNQINHHNLPTSSSTPLPVKSKNKSNHLNKSKHLNATATAFIPGGNPK